MADSLSPGSERYAAHLQVLSIFYFIIGAIGGLVFLFAVFGIAIESLAFTAGDQSNAAGIDRRQLFGVLIAVKVVFGAWGFVSMVLNIIAGVKILWF